MGLLISFFGVSLTKEYYQLQLPHHCLERWSRFSSCQGGPGVTGLAGGSLRCSLRMRVYRTVKMYLKDYCWNKKLYMPDPFCNTMLANPVIYVSNLQVTGLSCPENLDLLTTTTATTTTTTATTATTATTTTTATTATTATATTAAATETTSWTTTVIVMLLLCIIISILFVNRTGVIHEPYICA